MEMMNRVEADVCYRRIAFSLNLLAFGERSHSRLASSQRRAPQESVIFDVRNILGIVITRNLRLNYT